MIRVIYVILAIVIKDFKLRMNNKNLLLRKNAIQFKTYAQKTKMISSLYYFLYYGSQILIDLRVYAQLRKTWAEISS